MYEAEKRALVAIKMALPHEIKHTFRRYTTSKELWDALEKRYEGNAEVNKSKVDLLKKQFVVFKCMKNESLEEVITKFYHLLTEVQNYGIDRYTDGEINDKLLDALSAKWNIYTLMSKGYDTTELEEVVGMLRSYELNMRTKEIGYDQVQDPRMYYGVPSSSSMNASSDSATTFLSNKSEATKIVMDADGKVCVIASPATTINQVMF